MSEPEERSFLALLHVDLQAMPHNNLLDAADFLSSRVAARVQAGDRAGIAFDMMAALTMSAFAAEAVFNVVGSQLFGADWPAVAQKKKGKRAAVYSALGIQPDPAVRPYRTLDTLRELRDSLAHGKPYTITRTWQAEGTHREHIRSLDAAVAALDPPVSVAAVVEASEDVSRLWNMLREAAGLDAIELSSGGATGYEIVERG
jgi:hypothetical protein